VITLDRIKDVNLVEKILNHSNISEQIKEWQELGIVDESFNIEDVLETNSEGKHLSKEYEHLPIDTKYFKDLELEILSQFDDLDKSLDGWLIKSENYQALNTILPKFKEKVQTIYIDPPFNKENDAGYFYNVKYKDSSWITLLENRLQLARDLLNEIGSIFVRCDYNGNMYVRLLMNEIFGDENFRNEIAVKRGGTPISLLFKQFGELDKLGITYDNLIWFSKTQVKIKIPYRTIDKKREGHWTNFYKSGLFYDRPTMRYELLGIKIEKGQWLWSKERAMQAVRNYEDYLKEKSGISLEEYWEKMGRKIEFIRRNGNKIEYWIPPKEKEILDNNWLDILMVGVLPLKTPKFS
jgi:adenine-specific DNA-methyltransferase